MADYDWAGRTIERHRGQIREALGFRESTRANEDELIEWLAAEICPMVLADEGVRAGLLARCRKLRIEPPVGASGSYVRAGRGSSGRSVSS
ncbi:hypothetical protein [Actinomadura montaniterrae]|uniref:hypothetical protein n=1 Tax=Actinomadura montaniterrae TaxID=1803903 RepID=UPI00178C5229|nr:hypothetical protein [Actinomadura montaniterrae]